MPIGHSDAGKPLLWRTTPADQTKVIGSLDEAWLYLERPNTEAWGGLSSMSATAMAYLWLD